jgi:hypothetical protein
MEAPKLEDVLCKKGCTDPEHGHLSPEAFEKWKRESILRQNPIYSLPKSQDKSIMMTIVAETQVDFESPCTYCTCPHTMSLIEVDSADYHSVFIHLCRDCFFRYIPEHMIGGNIAFVDFPVHTYVLPFNIHQKLDFPPTFSLREYYYKDSIHTSMTMEDIAQAKIMYHQSWFEIPMYIKGIVCNPYLGG